MSEKIGYLLGAIVIMLAGAGMAFCAPEIVGLAPVSLVEPVYFGTSPLYILVCSLALCGAALLALFVASKLTRFVKTTFRGPIAGLFFFLGILVLRVSLIVSSNASVDFSALSYGLIVAALFCSVILGASLGQAELSRVQGHRGGAVVFCILGYLLAVLALALMGFLESASFDYQELVLYCFMALLAAIAIRAIVMHRKRELPVRATLAGNVGNKAKGRAEDANGGSEEAIGEPEDVQVKPGATHTTESSAEPQEPETAMEQPEDVQEDPRASQTAETSGGSRGLEGAAGEPETA